MIKDLVRIQNELKVPKNQTNTYANYKFRSAEDILQNVKPLLAKYNCQMTITDDIVAVGNRVYVKASVTIKDADGNCETVTAFAREPETKKGLSEEQISGCASSYSRKYALCAMFLLDDTKDADTNEYHYQTSAENDRISAKEVELLRLACKKAGKSFSGAVRACNATSPEDITGSQFKALMSQLEVA